MIDGFLMSLIREGYREGLRLLNTMSTEGQSSPESFTQQSSNEVNVNENREETVIIAFLSMRPGYATSMAADSARKWEAYRIPAPLTGPSGQCVSDCPPVMYHTSMCSIPDGVKNPEAAFRLVDCPATKEGSIRSSFGVEGVHWRKATEGEADPDSEPSEVTALPYNDVSDSWTQMYGLIRSTRFTCFPTANPDPYAPGMALLDGHQAALYQGFLLPTAVSDYQPEYMVAFITGDMHLDTKWDSCVETIQSIAPDSYLALYQEACDASAFAVK